jgi:hypothetical protein
MAGTSAQEEFLAITRKSQEAVIAVIRTLAEPVRTVSPKLPSIGLPFTDKLPEPADAMARTYDFAEQLLANQRKFAEDLLEVAASLMPGRAENAPTADTYRPGQIVPLDGTVECTRHHDVQDHVIAGTRFAPCTHHHEHSKGCAWQYV